MVIFWIAAAVLAAGSAGLIMAGAARAVMTSGQADPSVKLYHRALSEIDELAERDLLQGEALRAARSEAARRLLSAAENKTIPTTATLATPVRILAGVGASVLALVVYLLVGAPGMADQPFTARLEAWRNHPETATPDALVAALRSKAKELPTDPEPLRRLAILQTELGDADGATHALRKAIAIAPGRNDLILPLGQLLVARSKGVVGPESSALFRDALTRDPTSPVARYYLARAQIATGAITPGLSEWRAVLAALAPDDPQRAPLAEEIATVEKTGALPAVAAAEPQAPPQITAAIAGMVEGLATRLKSHPDDPAGWVRLVRAYTVMGEGQKQQAALAEARRRYAGNPVTLAQLNDALTAGK